MFYDVELQRHQQSIERSMSLSSVITALNHAGQVAVSVKDSAASLSAPCI